MYVVYMHSQMWFHVVYVLVILENMHDFHISFRTIGKINKSSHNASFE